ncbi:HD domain-containing protein [bacterium]|nr:HD domain-containing protein [candidate division CSSED10-310 bacterium]
MSIGRYQVIEEIHRGEISSVYAVRDRLTGDRLAMKKLHPDPIKAQVREFRDRYLMMSGCSHHLLVPVLDFGFDAVTNSWFYIMPWIDHVQIQNKQWTLNELVILTIQLCQTFVYIHRMGFNNSSLCVSHILWLEQADDSGGFLRLIDYCAGDNSTDPWSESNAVSDATGADEFQYRETADVNILFHIISDLIDKARSRLADDPTGRNEARGLRQLRDIIHNVLFESAPGTDERSWILAIRLITAFYDHAYSQSPARRISFTEGPFLGREETTSMMTRWLDDPHAGSGEVLILSGLKGMGRRRLLRYWLPRRRIERTDVFELNPSHLKALIKISGGITCDAASADNKDWFSNLKNPLLVVYPDTKEAFVDIDWKNLFQTIHERGWKLIVSVDEWMLSELMNRSLIDGQIVTRHWLTPISFTDSCRLLASLLGTPLSRRLQQETFKLARGNPSLIVETVNFWISEDLLVRENGRWHLTPQESTGLPVPPDIQKLFRERLEALSGDAISFLQMLALLDHPVDTEHLEAIFEIHDLPNILDMLLKRDILSIDDCPETGLGYYFSHSIIRLAVLESMSDEDIREGHNTIASRMEQLNWSDASIAYHWLYAGEQEKGIRKGLNVAWDLRYKGDFLRAEEWVDRLLRNSDGLPPELKGQVMYLLSEISLLRHRHQDVIDSAHAGLELLPVTPENYETRSFLYQHLGQVHMREARFEEASIAIRAGLDELKDAKGETSVTLRILAGAIARHQGSYRLAWKALDEARKESVHITDPMSAASAHATILNLNSTLVIDKGRIDEARKILDEAIGISDSRKFSFYRAVLRNKRAELEIALGNYSTAESYLADSMRICQTGGIVSEAAVVWLLNGSIATQRGHFEDAESYYKRSLEIAKQLNRKLEILKPKRLLARSYRIMGRFDEARTILDELSQSYHQALKGPAGCSILIETGFLDIEQAQYSKANRHFQAACQWMTRMHGYRDEAWARYGLALTAWRLNHLGRTRLHLIKARDLASKIQNKILLAWIWLLQARLNRLDRDRAGYETALQEANRFFSECESKPGFLAVAELKLRNTIDTDLSDSVWDDAIRLWEDARSVGAWRQIVDVALTLTRLGVRRGNYQQIAGLLDAVIGMVRDRGCKEELWRLLRIRAQSLEEQGFKSSARESLKCALTTVSEVVKDIRSPMFKKTYRSRYDVQSLKNRLDQLEKETRFADIHFETLPSLKNEDEARENIFSYNSEHHRALRNAVHRFRHHFDNRDLVEDLSNVTLKITSVDRLIIYLRPPGEELFEIVGFKRVGMAPDIDGKLIRSSPLFEKVVNQKHFLLNPNIELDPNYSSLSISRHIGRRAVLITPMRAAREVVGLIYTDVKPSGFDVLTSNAHLVQELADEAALSLEIGGLYRDLDETFMSMVRALGTAVDAKDPHTHGHASRVAEYALGIGREMGLRQEELRDLEIGAYLHDLGKIGIAGVILKSHDKLTESEMESIRHHPEIGTRILTPVRKLSKVALAIRQHHERYDGKGYPDQLKGEEILLIARIISVADALDAMTTKRPYQEAMTIGNAVGVIASLAGTQFDPLVTGALKKLYSRGEIKLL